ncbi:uncharacterized protein At2g39795, mitochondrial [Carya illinoinensis]|uniref:Mitochondrial glycoprotein n=1 Tax=Carya illinoinensis TaxID=32201 RepID=A0A8T1Q6N6_CARIL|nr:uncharacterized protein At2g39795, mitochondrial [Carya illinoinensis]KAG6649680.1 hypothetical protein CIPAW_07G228200 [Carya illinoinensis]
MARFIRTAQRTLCYSSSWSKATHIHHLYLRSLYAISPSLFQARPYASESATKSPFEVNILRILRTEIQYQSEYAPPHKPVTKFNSFTVEDRPGEQWITMRRKFGDTENIKIEATMFDGCEPVPKPEVHIYGGDVRLHLSLLVDISRGDGCNELEFLCSSWPDSLEVQKVYILRRNRMLARPYMGPDFRKLDAKIRKTLKEYLEARGVNDDLSVFLHQYMMNKDSTELIRWLGSVKTFVEK